MMRLPSVDGNCANVCMGSSLIASCRVSQARARLRLSVDDDLETVQYLRTRVSLPKLIDIDLFKEK